MQDETRVGPPRVSLPMGSCEHFRSHCDGGRSKLLAGPAKIFTRYFLMEKAVLQ
jgi:hypothetical protein